MASPAREVVNGYFLYKSTDAYDEAKKLLEKRYSSPFATAVAIRYKLEAWPVESNRNGKELRQLSDFLNKCATAMDEVEAQPILNDSRQIRQLQKKLPEWLSTRGKCQVGDHNDAKGTYPTFKLFSQFVFKESEIMCDPETSSVPRMKTQETENQSKAQRQPQLHTPDISEEGRE